MDKANRQQGEIFVVGLLQTMFQKIRQGGVYE